MKVLNLTTLALAVSLLCTSCGGSDKKNDEKPAAGTETEKKDEPAGAATKLEGSWEIKRAEGMMAEENVGTVYTFSGNKLSFGKGGYTNPGKTEVTDSTFSFQADGNELKFNYIYKFNGDTLVVKMEKGSQVFHMVKK